MDLELDWARRSHDQRLWDPDTVCVKVRLHLAPILVALIYPFRYFNRAQQNPILFTQFLICNSHFNL